MNHVDPRTYARETAALVLIAPTSAVKLNGSRGYGGEGLDGREFWWRTWLDMDSHRKTSDLLVRDRRDHGKPETGFLAPGDARQSANLMVCDSEMAVREGKAPRRVLKEYYHDATVTVLAEIRDGDEEVPALLHGPYGHEAFESVGVQNPFAHGHKTFLVIRP